MGRHEQVLRPNFLSFCLETRGGDNSLTKTCPSGLSYWDIRFHSRPFFAVSFFSTLLRRFNIELRRRKWCSSNPFPYCLLESKYFGLLCTAGSMFKLLSWRLAECSALNFVGKHVAGLVCTIVRPCCCYVDRKLFEEFRTLP